MAVGEAVGESSREVPRTGFLVSMGADKKRRAGELAVLQRILRREREPQEQFFAHSSYFPRDAINARGEGCRRMRKVQELAPTFRDRRAEAK